MSTPLYKQAMKIEAIKLNTMAARLTGTTGAAPVLLAVAVADADAEPLPVSGKKLVRDAGQGRLGNEP